MKGVTLVLVLTAELVLCNGHGLRAPQSFYQQALSVNNAYILGQKYEVLKSMVVAGDLAGLEPNIPEDYWKCPRSISLNQMRNSAFKQIRDMLPTDFGTQELDFDLSPGVGPEDETNKVVAFWDGVRRATQFTIDMLKQLKSSDTTLADSITLAKKRRVEASKQFVAALLFGNYDERPEIWEYTYEARSKLNKYYTKNEKDAESMKLGFIALIQEHPHANALVSKMFQEHTIDKLPAIQLLFVYGMLCKVEQEKRSSASTTGWAGILKLLESHAPRIDERCDSWATIATLLDRQFNHLLVGDVLGILQGCVAETAGMSVNKHGSTKAPPSSSSGSPTISRLSNPSATGSPQLSPKRASSRHSSNASP